MSSTRGYFLGQVIDDLDGIAHQVQNRARLGLLDLNRLLEDFFKDVLDIMLDGEFRNLNAHRSNEPGLDLGSTRLGIGVQVTSRATSAKVNATLTKVTDEQLQAYDRIVILVIGDGQSSYTLDTDALTRTGFDTNDIWDVTELCRQATSLSLLKLQQLHQLVSAEVARVRVELELPRADGSYPTGLDSYIEQVGQPAFSDASLYFASSAAAGIYSTAEDAASDLRDLALTLAELPRISREFLAFIVSKSEPPTVAGATRRRANADLIQRFSRYPDTIGELRFLEDRGFISRDDPDEPGRSPYYEVHLPLRTGNEYFYEGFFAFLEDAEVDVKQVLVSLDFSPFGEAAPKTH